MSQEDVDAVGNVGESGRDGTKFQFLRSRNIQNSDSNYHPTHKQEALADIPDMVPYGIVVAQQERDRDGVTIKPSPYQLTDEDAAILKREITHLSFETILKIFEMYHYNVAITIAAANEMVAPQLMPDQAKAMYVANISIERDYNPTKKDIYKQFYMAKTLRNVVSNKTLVDFYYSEKNKIGGNWRLELEDEEPMTSEERIELQEKMAASGLKIAKRDSSVLLRKWKQKKYNLPNLQKKQNLLRPDTALSKHRLHTDDMDSDDESVDSGYHRHTFEKSGTVTPIPTSSESATSSAAAAAADAIDTDEEIPMETEPVSLVYLEKEEEAEAPMDTTPEEVPKVVAASEVPVVTSEESKAQSKVATSPEPMPIEEHVEKTVEIPMETEESVAEPVVEPFESAEQKKEQMKTVEEPLSVKVSLKTIEATEPILIEPHVESIEEPLSIQAEVETKETTEEVATSPIVSQTEEPAEELQDHVESREPLGTASVATSPIPKSPTSPAVTTCSKGCSPIHVIIPSIQRSQKALSPVATCSMATSPMFMEMEDPKEMKMKKPEPTESASTVQKQLHVDMEEEPVDPMQSPESASLASTRSSSTTSSSSTPSTPSVTPDRDSVLATPEPRSSASFSSTTSSTSSGTSTTPSTSAPPPPAPFVQPTEYKLRIADIFDGTIHAKKAACAAAKAAMEAANAKAAEEAAKAAIKAANAKAAEEAAKAAMKAANAKAAEEAAARAASEAMTSSAGKSSEPKKIKKKYRKKTLDELRNGPLKIYPGRERKAKKFFE